MTAHATRRSLPRVLLVLAMAAAMVATAVGGATASDQFPDVADGHPFHAEIGWMAEQAITGGFADGNFKPGRDVSRQAYMAFLYRMAGSPAWPGCDDARFSDVGAGHSFCVEITWGAAMGITNGFADGTFKPGRDVTRQAAAAFQYRAVGWPTHSHSAEFSDVSSDHPFHDEISWMDGEGIAEGFDDGTYRPGKAVTRQAAAAFLFRQDAAGFTVDPGEAPGIPDFTVSPATATFLPDDDNRGYTVDTGDARTVTIELAVCGNVDVTDGTVSFAVDSSGSHDVAGFGTVDATISDVEVDGVPFPGAGTGESITVNGGELTFVLYGADTPECVTPVIFHDRDGDGLDVQADGRPIEDFGIGGETTFSDVTGVEMTPQSDANPFGTQHQVTAMLLGGDVDGDGEADVLPLSGQTIDFRIVRYEDADTRQFDCGRDTLGAGTTVTPAPGSDVTDANGVAVLTYTGPADPGSTTEGDARYDCIIAEWDGANSPEGDPYAPQGPVEGTATKDWLDGEGVPSSLELRPDEAVNPVDTNHTLTATVTDQFGDPVGDVTVRFDITRDDGNPVTADPEFTYTRTTNALGEAELTYHGPNEEAQDTITATALDDDGNEISGASDSATTTWSEPQ